MIKPFPDPVQKIGLIRQLGMSTCFLSLDSWQAMHAKDGKWPTDPARLGQEVLIGKGDVDFLQVLTGLLALGYKGAVTIERETSGPQQIADVRDEKLYLERILAQIRRT